MFERDLDSRLKSSLSIERSGRVLSLNTAIRTCQNTITFDFLKKSKMNVKCAMFKLIAIRFKRMQFIGNKVLT